MDLLDFFKRVGNGNGNSEETTLMAPTLPVELTNYYFLKGSKAACKDPVLIQFDGASDPNPGQSCGAAVVYTTHESLVGLVVSTAVLFSGRHIAQHFRMVR